jgi:hypothetical protein
MRLEIFAVGSKLSALTQRFDRFETEIHRELRTLGNRIDLAVIEISKI